MRKTITAFLIICALFGITSCTKIPDAAEMLSEFKELYSAGGTVYTSTAKEGDSGYISSELFRKIYIFDGDVPEEFAVLLNYHADYGAECGVFISQSSYERERIIEMCTERIRLLSRGSENVFITVAGPIVFYSAMPDRALAEIIWRKILDAHT